MRVGGDGVSALPANQSSAHARAPRHAAGRLGLPARERSRGLPRVLSWLAGTLSVLVLLGSSGGYLLVHRYDGNINRLEGVFDGLERPPGESAAAEEGPVNVLIVGSDSREGLAPGEDFQGPDETITGQRADTIILAHLYGDDDLVQLVSFPRDSWVQVPASPDPVTGELRPAHETKINASFLEGGPALLIATVQQLTGLQVDHYVQIDFDGFTRMVDELGGVEVCLPEAAQEEKSGIDLPAGRSVVGGDQALAFVRQRQGLPRGDIDRIARQQQFIGAIVRKTLSAGTLSNPFKLNGFLEAATASLQVDQGLQLDDLRDLALRARTVGSDGVVFTTVPVADPGARRKGQSVVLLDDAAAAQLFDQLRRDVPPVEPGPDAPPPAEPLIVAPDRILVEVRNGGGVPGLATRVSAELEAAGFLVTGEPGDVPGAAAGTVVRHGPDRADSARTLVAALPGATAELDPSLGRTLQVVAGSGYAGVTPVQVQGAAPPSGAPPPVTTAEVDPCAV